MKKLFKSRKGQGMVEYILIVIIVIVLVFVAYKAFGGKVADQFNKMAGKVASADSV
ncbi:MAG: hypothetical protein LBN20_02360 [Endomicrobium sp.]|jgi:Flp pilus assembly pilin Flp|nr:hypothetical protein [Endomicrobium sp.]